MALDLAGYLKGAFTDASVDKAVDIEHVLFYIVDTLHRANITMFGRWWGTPTSLDSFDPDMSLPSKRLLDMACAGQRMRPCRLLVQCKALYPG